MDVEGYGLITGAASGIGRSTALAFASEGALGLTLADLSPAALQEVSDEVLASMPESRRSSFRVVQVVVDVSSEKQVGEMVARAVAEFGRLDFAVNSAGVVLYGGKVAEMETEKWGKTMRIDLDGLFYCLRAELRVMLKQEPRTVSKRTGRQERGSIVNLASTQAHVALSHNAPYISAKHGVLGLTKAASEDHVVDGVRVNCVSPGWTATPMNFDKEYQEAQLPFLKTKVAAHRWGTPEEVADAILFLAGGRSTYVTGAAVNVDGGHLQA